MLRFTGTKSPERRKAVVGENIGFAQADGRLIVLGFTPYRKTEPTYAVRLGEAFEVETLEGLHTGKAGDYLAIGVHGEMYPIDAAVFEETYVEAV